MKYSGLCSLAVFIGVNALPGHVTERRTPADLFRRQDPAHCGDYQWPGNTNDVDWCISYLKNRIPNQTCEVCGDDKPPACLQAWTNVKLIRQPSAQTECVSSACVDVGIALERIRKDCTKPGCYENYCPVQGNTAVNGNGDIQVEVTRNA